ncbi:MAG: hypothetical protein A2939_01490 [Parcubacteria group bacterium RIFCSPLOWO2_01_FULL_48_18]|nr:MAG: hypothetical protein A2939_01490 [Parcubacteria group bacterium RIFCSPLOWO2_01_FULL_48_18]OHB22120.1 MAG: hypothetical protein A3J67_04340 [Parcubacteria group bacterium RIFCSPHIGHO2_02_FULL_48_10b]
MKRVLRKYYTCAILVVVLACTFAGGVVAVAQETSTPIDSGNVDVNKFLEWLSVASNWVKNNITTDIVIRFFKIVGGFFAWMFDLFADVLRRIVGVL